MVKFAKEIGAMRGDRPDWYAVAEHLAEIARPDLLNSQINRIGRRGIDWTMLVFDVDLVMRQKRCTITEACKELCGGYLPHGATVTFLDGRKATVRAASQHWKGKKWETVRQRYYDSIKERCRPAALANNFCTEIRDTYIRTI